MGYCGNWPISDGCWERQRDIGKRKSGSSQQLWNLSHCLHCVFIDWCARLTYRRLSKSSTSTHAHHNYHESSTRPDTVPHINSKITSKFTKNINPRGPHPSGRAADNASRVYWQDKMHILTAHSIWNILCLGPICRHPMPCACMSTNATYYKFIITIFDFARC